jgi:hypothetical protein
MTLRVSARLGIGVFYHHALLSFLSNAIALTLPARFQHLPCDPQKTWQRSSAARTEDAAEKVSANGSDSNKESLLRESERFY